jgi:hypothetical protein
MPSRAIEGSIALDIPLLRMISHVLRRFIYGQNPTVGLRPHYEMRKNACAQCLEELRRVSHSRKSPQ